MTCCNWPDCTEEGTFPAPRNPRNLRERQYFCAQHIKEFNKRWNGLDGFSENEIYGMQDPTSTWKRPSWAGEGLHAQAEAASSAGAYRPQRGKIHPNHMRAETMGREKIFAGADDLYGFFNSRLARELNGEGRRAHVKLPADVQAACAIFSIESPMEEALLKRRYLNLVKQHHPDVNKSPDAPEQIKRINVAYKILTNYTMRRV